MKTKQTSGFTIIELLITLLVASAIIVIGVPNMNEFVKNERLTSYANTLLSDMMLARSKAVEQNVQVIICASDDEESCTNSDYQDGWIVSTAPDGVLADGELIKVQQAITGDIRYELNDLANRAITFDPRGFTPDVPVGSVISICDERGDEKARALTISPTGRVSRGVDPTCS